MNSFEVKTYRIWKILGHIGSFILFAVMCFLVINIILRSFFNKPIIGSTEIVCYLSLIAGALAIAVNQYDDGNIKVTLIMELVPPRVRDIISFIAELVLSGGFAFILYYFIMYSNRITAAGDKSMELGLPKGIFAAILCVGLACMLISNIIKTIVRGYYLVKKMDFEEHKSEFQSITSPKID